jgi:MSHA biogenesis protein MshN
VSVINKMLRDLDDRQAAGTLQVRVQDGREGIARDTQSIRDGRKAPSAAGANKTQPWVLALVLILALAGGMTWWWLQGKRPAAVDSSAQIPVAAPATAPMMTTPATQQPEAPPSKGQSKAQPGRTNGDAQPSIASPKVPELPLAASSKPAIPAVVAKNLASLPTPTSVPEPSLRMDTVVRPGASGSAGSAGGTPSGAAPSGTSAPSTAPQAPVPAVPSAPAQTSRPSPVMEALGQAQALWSAGSRAGAIELLKDAIAVAERAPGGGGSSTLAALARELGRMELAEGRAAAALEMLSRLEPSLSGVPDIWALRGNAAQRLGRHEESSSAYLTALKLKPGEPRWMLGAAVSLAAQGQTGAAAEWAEQARAAGALSREVAAYLQQLGVPLRER